MYRKKGNRGKKTLHNNAIGRLKNKTTYLAKYASMGGGRDNLLRCSLMPGGLDRPSIGGWITVIICPVFEKGDRFLATLANYMRGF